MIKLLQGVGVVSFSCAAISFALAQTSAPPAPNAEQATGNPVCVRLEGRLAALSRGAADPRADQVKRYEDAAAKQQADLDRSLAQSKRLGCENGGFFSLFTGGGPQCQPINAQIQQMRDNLDRTMSELERLKSGSNDREGPRRALIAQLAQNNCGQQYQAAAAAAGPGGFLDALFGGTIVNSGGDGAPLGTYRTVCVRTCDGYYFPISYSAVPTRFPDDLRACQRECPATETALYTYRNPGEDINQAVSLGGQPYTTLPNAFHYRKEYSAACSCRRPGQSWADALKNSDDATTLESGDIVVTDQNSKALSQPPAPKPAGKPSKGGAANSNANQNPGAAATAPAATANPGASAADSAANGVRSIGPPFVVGH
ncbi:MAG TPA: DUF2865 domain-containing protein [Xanthobacteraceae bacterium]|jgi:hypothetical protein|nr:DUF2865 domain-containing protein [Xanthobacteraceae bacterium]